MPIPHHSSLKLLQVARIGRLVGIRGGLKLHIMSDFPYIFVPQALFHTKSSFVKELRIQHYDATKKLVIFEGFTSRESAAKLVNVDLYSTLEESRQMCKLRENEYLWEEIIGVNVQEEGENLGIVCQIERIGALDYLIIDTHQALIEQGMPRSFLIPNIDQYIIELSPQGIYTRNAKSLLEMS
ncbi:16S rRNA processing protein RimM [Helicobacter sp. MIT 05-5293]|uniref:ribosome maturation factor RimM n=1 Tax=Helicobacter sp. MIT 05-5293 TaxID=1548149 RepID=UPI00051DABDE|nr:ribosome maturation factor RimM [Helicobacter sp. MIT 05-5293]TLD81514.1 16S rRNA processing protein RimM [Helicobacter sp. MIT 05-5293]